MDNQRAPTTRKMPPLLKWPGGKRRILRHIIPILPQEFARYFEPFLGGGALYFALQPTGAVLSDIDPGLINCYIQVRDNYRRVTTHLRRMKNNERDYYRIRARVPSSATAQAARLIYLTTLSFNGIHRLNLKGEFNVPYGRKTHLNPCDAARLATASAALSGAEIRCDDFEGTLLKAAEGDLVFCDPPYSVVRSGNGFVKYNSRVFSWGDQLRLAKTLRRLADIGAKVVVTNACHPAVVQLYPNFKKHVVRRPSVIAASPAGRRTVEECIFTSF